MNSRYDSGSYEYKRHEELSAEAEEAGWAAKVAETAWLTAKAKKAYCDAALLEAETVLDERSRQ